MRTEFSGDCDVKFEEYIAKILPEDAKINLTLNKVKT
jgi:hypothetical protein